jgi:cytidylate kinase
MAILTISRQIGSITKDVTQTMAESWGYEHIDRTKIIGEMGDHGGRWREFGEEFDEHYPNIWERFDRSYTGYVALSQSTILSYALKDNVIIVGRGGNFLLRDVPHCLNVRIVAPVEQRVRTVMKRDVLSKAAARLFVAKVDKEVAKSVHHIYGHDINDPHAYDLFFDVGVVPIADMAGAIRTALLEKDKLKTEEAVRALRMKALAKEVEAGIATDPEFFVPVFEVSPNAERLVVTGIVHNPEESDRVKEAVKKITGWVPVKFSLHYR